MTVTVASFRQDFPEFASVAIYTNSQVQFYLRLAGKMLNVARWGNVIDEGTELYIAHNLALERKAQLAGQNGGVPGGATGNLAGKSVDKVSVNYDNSSAMEPDAGQWNLTTYGLRFIQMARMMGAGPVQVGLPVGCSDPLSSANAWIGPYPFPTPSGFSS